MQKTTVERAFELARSGTCQNVRDIMYGLQREGYQSCAEHLSSGSLKKQLKLTIKGVTEPSAVE